MPCSHCVFDQPGAGKTYTMLGTDEEPGIMVQALNDLFLEMRQNTDKAFKVTMSYLEVSGDIAIIDFVQWDEEALSLDRENPRDYSASQGLGCSCSIMGLESP